MKFLAVDSTTGLFGTKFDLVKVELKLLEPSPGVGLMKGELRKAFFSRYNNLHGNVVHFLLETFLHDLPVLLVGVHGLVLVELLPLLGLSVALRPRWLEVRLNELTGIGNSPWDSNILFR